MGQVIENAKLSIAFLAGSPVLNTGVTVGGTSPGAELPVLAGDVTVERTPGGAGSGDIFIWWPPSTFPAPGVSPSGGINGVTPGMIASEWYTDTGSGHFGIRVVTINVGGAAADLPFTVSVE